MIAENDSFELAPHINHAVTVEINDAQDKNF